MKTSLLWLCGVLPALTWGGVGGGLLTSCTDWDDHYNHSEETGGGSSQTLWQQLQADGQLSDFCQVLEQTKVFRMHKKTAVSYAQLLNSGQSFTVIAPVNGSFNKDSLLQLVQTNQGDSLVEKFFVLNHLSRTISSMTADAKRLLLLNSKQVDFGGGTVEGVAVSQANCIAKNGVMHVVNRPLPYLNNIYESLCDLPEFSPIGQLLRQYDIDFFDEEASVSSGIVEGVPVYVDSVLVEYNNFLGYFSESTKQYYERAGLLAAEDSTYWMVAPTAVGWQKAWQTAEKYFVYDEEVKKRDSLQQFYTAYALLGDAIYNMTNQKSVRDSLVSVKYNRMRPEYSVFYKPFEQGGVLANATPVTCSNGILYKTDEWPFTLEQAFFHELWTEAEIQNYIVAEKDVNYNVRRVATDSISEGAYLDIQPRTGTSNWELTFRINNTLSGNYDICAIVLPYSVYDKTATNVKPNKFRAYVNYVDEQGKAQSFDCDKKEFIPSTERIDTVVLASDFHFPTCNYAQSDIKVTVRLACSITARQTSQYAREMFLDCIYLRPRTPKSE